MDDTTKKLDNYWKRGKHDALYSRFGKIGQTLKKYLLLITLTTKLRIKWKSMQRKWTYKLLSQIEIWWIVRRKNTNNLRKRKRKRKLILQREVAINKAAYAISVKDD